MVETLAGLLIRAPSPNPMRRLPNLPCKKIGRQTPRAPGDVNVGRVHVGAAEVHGLPHEGLRAEGAEAVSAPHGANAMLQ